MQRPTPRRQFQPSFVHNTRSLHETAPFEIRQDALEVEEQPTSVLPAQSDSATRPLTLFPLSSHPLSPCAPSPPNRLTSRIFSAKSSFFAKKSRKRWFLLVLVLLGCVLLLLLTSFWLSSRANADVTLFQVQSQQAVPLIVGGGGILYPRQQLNLAYPVAERVLAVLVHPGDQVVPDQPLLRLDTTQLQAQLQQAEDNVAVAQSYLSSVSTNANAVTIAQAQQQFSLAKNKHTALSSESAYPLTHDGNLVSSLHGVVTAININAGEVFAPNAILLVIMDESSLVVHMQVPLTNIGQVRSSESAQIIPSALTDHVFSGIVNAVIPQANPQTSTFEVRVSVDDPQHLLLPGMNVFVRIQVPTTALVIPRLAAMLFDQLATVFVVHSQHAYLRSVKLLGRNEDYLLISSGLQSGECIVLLGLYQLHDGQPIHIHSIEHSTGGTL